MDNRGNLARIMAGRERWDQVDSQGKAAIRHSTETLLGFQRQEKGKVVSALPRLPPCSVFSLVALNESG